MHHCYIFVCLLRIAWTANIFEYACGAAADAAVQCFTVLYLYGCTHTNLFSVVRAKRLKLGSPSSTHLTAHHFSYPLYRSLSLCASFSLPSLLRIPQFSLGDSLAAGGYSECFFFLHTSLINLSPSPILSS